MTSGTRDRVFAADGRVIGARALATRRKLLDATEQLLSRDGVRELKVVDITRQVGSAPATFYQYFPDIENAVLALFDEVSDELGDRVTRFLLPEWSSPADIGRARLFVEAYWSLWAERYAVLRMGTLRGDEGDQRFVDSRQRGYVPMLDAMIATVTAAQDAGRLERSLHPFSVAACGLSMLIPLMSYTTGPHPEPGVGPLEVESIVRVLFASLTGFPP